MITLPRLTRDEMRANKKVLAELRSALVAHLPEADVEPQQLVRFGARTVLTIVVPIVAIVFVITSINVDEITSALSAGDWRWTVVAFALGLRHAARCRAGVRRVLPGQAAASGARPWCRPPRPSSGSPRPAGIGPAALNLRMLTRRGVSTTLAAATVALVQVSQFVVTLGLLLVLSLASGSSESALPISPGVLFAIGIVAALIASGAAGAQGAPVGARQDHADPAADLAPAHRGARSAVAPGAGGRPATC